MVGKFLRLGRFYLVSLYHNKKYNMKKIVLMALTAVGIVGSASAQHDDLYFVPKKKKVTVEQVEEKPLAGDEQDGASSASHVTTTSVKLMEMDEDTYNRRGSYLTEQGDAVSEFAMSDEGFVLITEEGDTIWMNTDTLRLSRVVDGEGWVNGFDGSESDYEYAMRLVRFRNPRYAIPVSSPLYWDVVYGGALWPSWEWNVYDDGMYAYVFPTRSNWYYWDYMTNYSWGWGPYYGYSWGYSWGGHYYAHMWYDPWYGPHYHGYHPSWHHGHHHGYYPGGGGKPGWGGGGPNVVRNNRTPGHLPSRRDTQAGSASNRNSSVRVVTGRTGGGSESRPSGAAVRSSNGNRAGGNEVVRRSTGSSSVSRSSSSNGSNGGYTSRSSSTGSTSSSYSRPSSTRSSSSSVSRSSSSSSSSSRSSSSSSYGSSSSRSSSSSSYSSGSSSRSSYGGGSSRSGGSSGGGSSRSSGGRR